MIARYVTSRGAQRQRSVMMPSMPSSSAVNKLSIQFDGAWLSVSKPDAHGHA